MKQLKFYLKLLCLLTALWLISTCTRRHQEENLQNKIDNHSEILPEDTLYGQ